MKRVSTIMLITELAKFGQLNVRPGKLSSGDPGFICHYKPLPDHQDSFISIRQVTDDILSFMRICADQFCEGTSPIFDQIQKQLL